jgi:AraC family transcriptional regulator, arabinose operon regulatory protein
MGNVVCHGARTGQGWCYWRTPAALLARYAAEPAISDFIITRSGYFPRCWQNAAWRPKPLPLHEAVVTLCLEGRGWVKDVHHPERPHLSVVPGEMVVVPPDTPHSYGADAQNPWTQLWFHAAGPRVVQFLTQLGVKGALYKGRVSALGPITDCLHHINQLRRQGCGRAVLLEGAALAEVVLARVYGESCLQPAVDVVPGSAEQAAERLHKLACVTAFLQENFRRNLSVAQVAQACHVSDSWLCHAFPRHAGFSPLGYLIHLRLQEACRALATTDRKLQDIGASVGYEDPFYFSRLFKRHLGLSPSEYRQQYTRNKSEQR